MTSHHFKIMQMKFYSKILFAVLYICCGIMLEYGFFSDRLFFSKAADPICVMDFSCFDEPLSPVCLLDSFYPGGKILPVFSGSEEDFDEVLKIPVIRKPETEIETVSVPASAPVSTHVVRRGDSISKLASYYGVPQKKIIELNSLKSSKILLGQKLMIPVSSKSTSLISKSTGFSWPLPHRSRITSGYGNRIHPVTKLRSFHNGIDLSAPKNTRINASMSGKVHFAGYKRISGNTVILKHQDNYFTVYAHCTKITVKIGQSVKSGDMIATVGRTGRTTGSHLHFSIKKGETYLDPLRYLPK